MKKGSIEFTTRQIVILILMLLIAVLIIFLSLRFGDRIKELVMNLFIAGERITPN